MNTPRLVTWVYVVVLTALGFGAAALFHDAYQEHARLKHIEADLQRKLAAARVRLQEQERILDRLKNDPAYVEKVMRERLNYVKPNETIFSFPK